MQFVNMSLSLSALHESADVVMLFNNHDLLSRLESQLSRTQLSSPSTNAWSPRSPRSARGMPPWCPTGSPPGQRSILSHVISVSSPQSARGSPRTPSAHASPQSRASPRSGASSKGAPSSPGLDSLMAEGLTGTIGFPAINRAIARHMAGALWPMSGEEVASGKSRMQDIVNSVCSDPVLKFTEARSSGPRHNTYPQYLWQEAARSLAGHFQGTDALDDDQRIHSAGTMVVARGFPEGVPSAEDKQNFGKAFRCHKQLPFGGDAGDGFSFRSTPTPFSTQAANAKLDLKPRSKANTDVPMLTAISNRSNSYSLIDLTLDRTQVMSDAGAYMHWFSKYGVSKDDISNSVDTLRDVVEQGYSYFR